MIKRKDVEKLLEMQIVIMQLLMLIYRRVQSERVN